MKGAYWLVPLGVALAAGVFSWLNRGERVILHMGVTTFYRAPLTLVLFLAFLAGMLAMMALTLRQDLRVRDELRVRGLLDGHPRPAETSASAHLLPAHGVASVDGSRDGHAPALDATRSPPPFAGDGAAYRHDQQARSGDGDATLSHPPLAARTEYRHAPPAAGDDGDATHPPLADRTEYRHDHPAAGDDGDATHPPLADRTEYRHDPLAADDDAARPHSPFAGDGAAFRRDEPPAHQRGDATLIHRREGEPPAA